MLAPVVYFVLLENIRFADKVSNYFARPAYFSVHVKNFACTMEFKKYNIVIKDLTLICTFSNVYYLIA